MKLTLRYAVFCWALLLGAAGISASQAQVNLADKPIAAGADVPGNLALTLSVEFPTAISIANLGAYADSSTFLGYFDPAKCYTYLYNPATPSSSYFSPTSLATGSNGHLCPGHWSGNYMNWAAMQTIDPFRWALSGGYRSVDTGSQTILEKAWGSTQGSPGGNFPYRGTSYSGNNNLPTSSVSQVTPFNNWSSFNTGIWGNGNTMVFSGSAGYVYSYTSTSVFDLGSSVAPLSFANTAYGSLLAYRVYVRVAVCDATLGTAMLESNCVQYQSGYKPEGLLQQYSKKIRFSAFGYLADGGDVRQGGALREPMGFIGPQIPQPLTTVLLTNPTAEWDGTTGIMNSNPDTATASASGVSQSGVMNYLNKFGEYGHNYKTYDNVSELYYAAVRYYENLGNVPEWTNNTNASILDGFPAVTNWTDPMLYSCQTNFILGIGDDHTWFDYNVGGNTNASGSRPMPSAVAADTINQASTWTTNLQTLQGITPTPWWPFDSGATYFIAGLAYGIHTNDIRPDLPNTQTISTYWMDVAEGQEVENLNPYYLASKYGGFNSTTIPAAPYTPTNPAYNMTTPISLGQYDPTGATIAMNGGNTQKLPSNYYNAGNANAMVAGLKNAFVSISSAVDQLTTSFSFSSPNVTGGTESFAANFDSNTWYGAVQAYTLTFDTGGNPLQTPLWNTKTTLQTQFAATGWQSARNIATWNGSTGTPFEAANLTSAQLTALTPSYSSTLSCTSSSCPYLNYLRGDQTNEVGGTGTQSLRARKYLLGDIVDAGLTPVTTPLQTFSDANNPGYNNFKTFYTTTAPRATMLYAGANDGMLHAILGSAGTEQFAYVPSAVYQGPNGTPQVDGLAELGNPSYDHHYYVDATPYAFDIDISRTPGYTGTVNYANPQSPSSPWRTILIGGLGKGGKSYYAIDVTNPTSLTSESLVAQNVLWEFSDSTMGYSYGAPVVVKTAKYGWTVILTSGYNNSDGYGYLYFVNPRTGALLEKVKTPSTSSGLTQASAFVKDYSDDTTDSVYVGDLNGQLWRIDLTGTSGSYPQPVLLARLTSSNPAGSAQPVTTAPLIEIHPSTRKRYVLVGTGVLLAATDINNAQMQSFYSILDGTASAFLPISTPVLRSNLTQVTQANLTQINSLTATGADGWYVDLGIDGGSGVSWRVLLNPVAYNGIVAFSTSLPNGNDPCSPQGSSRVYALDYSTVDSVLLSTTTGTTPPTAVAHDNYSSSAINLRFTGANGNPELVVGFTTGTPQKVPASLTGTLATRILNWREIPTAD